MYNPYGEEPRLNRFILISVVLHAIIFFTLPNLDSLLESDVPGMAGGGVIQVMHVETSVNPRPTPVTDRLSQTTIPRVTEPRPIPEVEPKELAVAQPKVPEVEQPKVEQSRPAAPEQTKESLQEEVAVVEPPIEESEVGAGEVLTSPTGPEVVVEPEAKEIIEPSEREQPQPEKPASQEGSGSGTGTQGSNDESGTSESGQGVAETAPPPPPPPPSGRSLHVGGGSPLYPKNAEHDGVEGTVVITVEVSAGGELETAVLSTSSGDERLDIQALRYIQGLWSFKPMNYDYTMDVEIIYSKEDNRFVSNLNYGEVKWLNVP